MKWWETVNWAGAGCKWSQNVGKILQKLESYRNPPDPLKKEEKGQPGMWVK